MFETLFEIGKQLLAETQLSRVLNLAIDKAIEFTGAERGMVILFDSDGKNLFETARNLDQQDIENPKFEISRSIINPSLPLKCINSHKNSHPEKIMGTTDFKSSSVLP